MSYEKRLDVTISGVGDYSLVIGMCAPYLAGTFTALFKPQFSEPYVRERIVDVGGNTLVSPVNFKAGDPLAVLLNTGIGAFVSTFTLPVIYKSATGEESIVLPFGRSFSDSNPEWQLGASPRRYLYEVTLATGGSIYYLATGVIAFSKPIKAGVVCNVRSAPQIGSEPAPPTRNDGMTGGNL